MIEDLANDLAESMREVLDQRPRLRSVGLDADVTLVSCIGVDKSKVIFLAALTDSNSNPLLQVAVYPRVLEKITIEALAREIVRRLSAALLALLEDARGEPN